MHENKWSFVSLKNKFIISDKALKIVINHLKTYHCQSYITEMKNIRVYSCIFLT